MASSSEGNPILRLACVRGSGEGSAERGLFQWDRPRSCAPGAESAVSTWTESMPVSGRERRIGCSPGLLVSVRRLKVGRNGVALQLR